LGTNLRGLLYGLREEEEKKAKDCLSTAHPSLLGLKAGHRALPSPTPLSRVERYKNRNAPLKCCKLTG